MKKLFILATAVERIGSSAGRVAGMRLVNTGL
jgi:hypothetical protein